jgi:glycosyltransferase involved in cell wall biosynthesis
MRLALVNTNAGWGGGELWYAEAAAALAARGHRVLGVAARGSELEGRLRSSGIEVVDAAALAAEPPDLCLVNSRKDLVRALRGRPAFRLALRRGIDRPLRDNPFRRPAWRRLSRILVNSDATGATVRRSLPWFPRDRITRVYNAVRFEPRAPAPPPDTRLRVGVVSRLVPSKGVSVLLEALVRIKAPFVLTVAGDGVERPRLERLAAALGILDRCRFLGHVADPAPVYAALDVVAIPSLYEGFCYTAVEAALAGLPVVASSASGLLEVVEDGRTGLLVPPRDPAALAAGLERISSDRDGARSLGEEGRRRARERFGPAAIYDELERFLALAAAEDPVG